MLNLGVDDAIGRLQLAVGQPIAKSKQPYYLPASILASISLQRFI
jgi:hypothetical protein